MDGATTELLARRYGRPIGTRRRRQTTAATLAILAGVGWAAWATSTSTTPRVHWLTVGYVVDGPGRTRVILDVSLPRGTRTVCTVRALDQGFGEVGILDVPIGPVSAGHVRRTVAIPTSQLAVTAMVKTCTDPR